MTPRPTNPPVGLPHCDSPTTHCGSPTTPHRSLLAPALASPGFRFAILLSRDNASLFRCFLHLRFNAALFRQNGMAGAISLWQGLTIIGEPARAHVNECAQTRQGRQ